MRGALQTLVTGAGEKAHHVKNQREARSAV